MGNLAGTETLTRVRLLGHLGEKFGEVWNIAISTPAEAFRAIEANVGGLREYIMQTGLAGVGYKIIVGKRPLESKEEFGWLHGKQEICIVPVVSGSGGRFGQIFIGAVLIAAAFTPGLQGVALWGTTTLASLAGTVGVSLVLGGVAQLLTSTPKAKENIKVENKPSYYFDGAVNTTEQGLPVPIFYGELEVGSHVISAGIATESL